MTPEQITTFAAHIEANTNQTIIDALAIGNNNAIVAWYNQEASPAVWVLQTNVSKQDFWLALDKSETLDDLPFTAVEQWHIDLMFSTNGGESFDPQPEATRDALLLLFPGGAGNRPNSRTAVLLAATRKATYAEAIFIQAASGPGGGDGSTQTGSAIAIFSGDVTLQNVRDAVAIINEG